MNVFGWWSVMIVQPKGRERKRKFKQKQFEFGFYAYVFLVTWYISEKEKEGEKKPTDINIRKNKPNVNNDHAYSAIHENRIADNQSRTMCKKKMFHFLDRYIHVEWMYMSWSKVYRVEPWGDENWLKMRITFDCILEN